MFGKGVNQEEEALLGNILRSINKKLDHSWSRWFTAVVLAVAPGDNCFAAQL